MKKNLNKLATLALTGILMTGMSFGALADGADIGEGAVTDAKTALTFKKELKLVDVDDNTVTPTTPGVTFEYTIDSGKDSTIIREIEGKNTTLNVYAPTDENGVSITEPGVTTTEAAFGKNDTAKDGKVIKNVTVDFKNVTFSKPGIYRWVIKETGYRVTDKGAYASALKKLSETNDERYLDVYVERNNEGDCVIKGYVLYKEGENVGKEEGKSGGYIYEENTYGVDGKDDVINSSEYRTYDITIQKLVEGAMADRSKQFEFDTKFSNISSEVTLTTSVTDDTGEEISRTGHDYKYTLSHGGTYTIKGIPLDATADLSEADYSEQGYSVKEVKKDNETVTAVDGKYAAGDNNKGSATTVVVTNRMTDIPVTGVVKNIAPYAAMVLGAGAFAGVFLGRKKSEDEE